MRIDGTNGYFLECVLLMIFCCCCSAATAQVVTDGSIRLVGGNSSSEGRVEVYSGGAWGTICDDMWGVQDALVACRQLGYQSVLSEHTKFGPGTGPILLDNVKCDGNEETLGDCSHESWGSHDCSHDEDVGVVCSNVTHNTTLTFPNDEVFYRLAGGNSPNEGVLQSRSSDNEAWNTICLDGSIFPFIGASLCQQAGYKFFCHSEVFGSREGSRDNLTGSPLKWAGNGCIGIDGGGTTCSLQLYLWDDEHPCTLEGALWVVCDNHLDFSLGFGVSESEGFLQVRCNNSVEWHGVCGDRWMSSTHAHQPTCRHLGYSDTASLRAYTSPVGFEDTLIEEIRCHGEERAVDSCAVVQTSFGCSVYAAIKCTGYNLELKLAQSHFPGGGHVVGRLRPSDEWGAICGTWDDRDTPVICRQLGFLTSISVTANPPLDPDTTPATVLVSAVGCDGSEAELSQCPLQPGFRATCDPKSNIYVECQGETSRFEVLAFLCGEIHYCGYECNQGRRDTLRPLEQETCKCDDACAFFNDCCYDYHSSCNPASDWVVAKLNGVAIQYYACVWTQGQSGKPRYMNFGWALVSFCPESWSVSLVRENCETLADEDDAIGSLPVYDAEGAVYKNIFCAVCHGVDPKELRKWSASFEFVNTPNTTFDSRFNVTITGTPTGRYVYDPPDSTLGTARTCPVHTVTSCSPQFANTSLEAACLDYFAPLSLNGIQYGNPHCAMCNGLTVEPHSTCGPLCSLLCSEDGIWEECNGVCAPEADNPTIEALFDFGWGGGEGSACQLGELYDPFLDRCRAVTCAMGVANEDGGCTQMASSVPELDLPPFTILTENCSALVNSSLGEAALYWQAVWDSDVANSQDVRLDVLVKSFDLVDDFGRYLFALLEQNTTDGQSPICNIERVAVFVIVGDGFSEIGSCDNASLAATDVFQTKEEDNNTISFEMIPTYLWRKLAEGSAKFGAAPDECLRILEMKCQEIIVLNPEEFASQGSSIRHTLTGLEFEEADFVVLQDGSAAICGPVEWVDPNRFALWIVSLICSCLSLLALAATFIIYSLIPTLRNTAGLYTMNLAVALFLAILLVVLAGTFDAAGPACVAFVALTHLSWLSAFFWMAMLSYNVARTFGGRMSASIDRPSRCRLMAAMFLVWGGALLIVSLCITLTLCDCSDLPPIYSRSSPCLFTRGSVLLVVFGVPVLTSLLLSVVCFILVIVSVRKTKSTSKMVHNKSQVEEALDEVKIYAKLALLMGLTWILAFISEAVGHVILSYLNVIVNTLQGVFLFVAFCLNQRVRALWRKARRAGRAGTTSGQQMTTMSNTATSRGSK